MRDKQIEEMVRELKDVWIVDLDGNVHTLNEKLWQDELENIAIELHNIGYRKKPDVAREIFEEIEKIEKRLLNRQKKCDKEAQKAGWYLEMREAYEGQSEGIGLCLDYLAELKKKYESEGEG